MSKASKVLNVIGENPNKISEEDLRVKLESDIDYKDNLHVKLGLATEYTDNIISKIKKENPNDNDIANAKVIGTLEGTLSNLLRLVFMVDNGLKHDLSAEEWEFASNKRYYKELIKYAHEIVGKK